MKIKTTLEIKESRCFAQSYNAKQQHDNKKWVAVDDLDTLLDDVDAEYDTPKASHIIQTIRDKLYNSRPSPADNSSSKERLLEDIRNIVFNVNISDELAGKQIRRLCSPS